MNTAEEILTGYVMESDSIDGIDYGSALKAMMQYAEKQACAFLKWNDQLCYDYHPDKAVWVYWDNGMVEYTTEEMYAQFILFCKI